MKLKEGEEEMGSRENLRDLMAEPRPRKGSQTFGGNLAGSEGAGSQ